LIKEAEAVKKLAGLVDAKKKSLVQTKADTGTPGLVVNIGNEKETVYTDEYCQKHK
jgi:hypothetical protein